MTTFEELCKTYQNTPEWHGDVFDKLYQEVQQTPWLKEHRDFVESAGWGMNDRPHHASWAAIIETMPETFAHCEIGVYRGQGISLVGLCAKHYGKRATTVGVSPFCGTGDSMNGYDKTLNYLADVYIALDKFSVPRDWFVPIKGYSQDWDVIEKAQAVGPYDLMYIDGSHEYTAVRLDINNYAPMLRKGGILVMDDSAFFLNMPEFSQDKGYNRCWKGEKFVSLAVQEWLEPRKDFEHLFAIGHNRVFRKTQ